MVWSPLGVGPDVGTHRIAKRCWAVAGCGFLSGLFRFRRFTGLAIFSCDPVPKADPLAWSFVLPRTFFLVIEGVKPCQVHGRCFLGCEMIGFTGNPFRVSRSSQLIQQLFDCLQYTTKAIWLQNWDQYGPQNGLRWDLTFRVTAGEMYGGTGHQKRKYKPGKTKHFGQQSTDFFVIDEGFGPRSN